MSNGSFRVPFVIFKNLIMARKFLLLSVLFIFGVTVFAQKQTITGIVKDSITGETIIGANVVLQGTTTGTTTDINGNFSIQLNKGKYTLQVSFIGYTTVFKPITVTDSPLNLTFNLTSAVEISGVEVIAESTRNACSFH